MTDPSASTRLLSHWLGLWEQHDRLGHPDIADALFMSSDESDRRMQKIRNVQRQTTALRDEAFEAMREVNVDPFGIDGTDIISIRLALDLAIARQRKRQGPDLVPGGGAHEVVCRSRPSHRGEQTEGTGVGVVNMIGAMAGLITIGTFVAALAGAIPWPF